jgi:ABC-2 type transport system ATP-binding protein
VRPATQVLIGLFAIFAFMGFFIDSLPMWINLVFAPFIFQFSYSLAWKTFFVYLTHSNSLKFSWTYAASGGCSYLTAIMLFLVNIVITFSLSLYFQQIVPSRGVITKPWYFVFDFSLWHISSPTASDVTEIRAQGHQYLEFTPPRALRLTNTVKPDQQNQESNSSEYSQQIDDEEQGSEMIDDLNRRKMDNIDEYEYDEDDEDYCPETDIGYLPPLHPYQPLNDYESDNIVLSFKNVRKTFGTIHKRRTHALKRVNLNISRQLVVLLGKNGSGKSTLLNLMTGLALPSDGSIKVTLPQLSARSRHVDSLQQYTANTENTNNSTNIQINSSLDPFATHHTSDDPFALDSTSTATQTDQNNQSIPSQSVTMNNFIDAVNTSAQQQPTNQYQGPRPLYGYCPQDNTLFPYLTVQEHLIHMSRLIQYSYLSDEDEMLTFNQMEQVITDALTRLGLNNENIINAKVSTLPYGIQRRLCLAIASLHHPSILLLDDPLHSLDLHSQRLLIDYLQYLKTLGTTIVMTCNNINEVEFADKVGIVSHGNVLLYGSPHYLKSVYHAGYALSIEKVQDDDIFADCLQLSSIPLTASITDRSIDDEIHDSGVNTDTNNPIGPNLNETITTKSGQAIFDALQNNHKFASSCNVIYDSQTEINFILDQELLSPSSSFSSALNSSTTTSSYSQQNVIPQLLTFLESQKQQLKIRNIKLTMKTLEDVFIAANQGKTTLRNPKIQVSSQIAEGTLPELAHLIEEKQHKQDQKREKRRQTASQFNTDVDDNNDPYLQLNGDGNNIKSDDIFDSDQINTPHNSVNNIGSNAISDDQVDQINHGQLDSTIHDQTQYQNLSSQFSQLWQHPFTYQPLESILMTQIAGHLRKDYQILWNTPTKFSYLIFVPIFVCVAIFFTAPHDVILSTSSQPLPLTLQTMPFQSPVEWGISVGVNPEFQIMSGERDNDTFDQNGHIHHEILKFGENGKAGRKIDLETLKNTFLHLQQLKQQKYEQQFNQEEEIDLDSFITTNMVFDPQQTYERASRVQIQEFLTSTFAPSYKLDEKDQDLLDDIDILEYFMNKKYKEPQLMQVLQQFSEQQINRYPSFRSTRQFKYNNPHLLSFLASYNSTIDEETSVFTDLKGTLYVNHTSIPLAFSLMTRMYETLYNYAIQQQFPFNPLSTTEEQVEQLFNPQQAKRNPSALMLLPNLTQIYNQANISLHSGHALVLALLMSLGLSCYPIIQSYYYSREKVSGWDDVQKLHGLYLISKWFSRAVYDLSIYFLHVLVIAISVALSGFGRTTRETFVEFDHDFSVVGHFVTMCSVIGIQLLLFMHCFIYFYHKDPIKSQTYLMMTLFFGPVFVFLSVLVTSIVPPLMIVILLIGAICPTTILLVAVILTYYDPKSLWILLTISILESILLIFFVVISATVKPLNCTAENLFYKNRHQPPTISQDPNNQSPYRHVYVSELASREMYNVVHDYNTHTHPILSYGLLKRYGIVSAVNNVYFGVENNKTMAIIGPNQAGKSTILKLLLNLESTSTHTRTNNYPRNKPFNTAVICNNDSQSKNIEQVTHHEGLGYVPQDLSFLNQHLTARQHLEWMGCIRGLSVQLIDEYTLYLLYTTGLNKVADQRVQNYTNGMKQRLAVALALIGNPKVVIMDEMTSASDPLSALQIRQLIKQTSLTRTTLFTSHNIDDVEVLSDRICILSHGVITAIGNKEELITTLGKYYSLHLITHPSQENNAIQLLLSTFENHPNVIEFDTQQSISLNPAPSNLQDFTNNEDLAVNQIDPIIPQQPPIKLIESRQQRIIFHINSNYFSLSTICCWWFEKNEINKALIIV